MRKISLNFLYLSLLVILILSACGGGNAVSESAVDEGESASSTTEAEEQAENTDVIVPINLAGPDIGTTMEWVDGGLLIYVPAGEFIMGHGGADNPEHPVSLRDFWIYRNEVTNSMYANCVTTGNCLPPESSDYLDPEKANEPVIGVDWAQADAYCTWVKGDLPTEAQWEKTARGPEGNIYPWGDAAPSCDLLNFDRCLDELSDVTDFPEGQSFYEALDMAGNVFEWVADWYDPNYYQTSPEENPYGPEEGTVKSVRGSSFESDSQQAQVFNRFFLEPEKKREDLGFRCVLIDPVFPAPLCVTTSRTAGEPGDGWEPPGSSQTSCQPTDIGIGDTFCHSGSSYVNVFTGQGGEGVSVTADGEALDCTQYQAGRITCGPLTPDSSVNISVCGGGCEEGSETDSSTPGEGQGDFFCMTGFTYNPETGNCEYQPNRLDPTNNENCGPGYQATELGCLPEPGGYAGNNGSDGCAPGFYYDTGMESCVPSGDNPSDCFWGYANYPGAENCSATCLDGYEYNSELGCCAPEGGGDTPEFGCGVGYYYDTLYQTCVPNGGYEYPECGEGYYYNAFEETCLPVPNMGGNQSCSEGYYYNAFEDACLPVPDMTGDQNCSEGYYFDTGLETCVPIPGGNETPVCPDGYFYDTGLETCTPFSGSENGAGNGCQTALVTVVGCYEDHGGDDGGPSGCAQYNSDQCGLQNNCYWDTLENVCKSTGD